MIVVLLSVGVAVPAAAAAEIGAGMTRGGGDSVQVEARAGGADSTITIGGNDPLAVPDSSARSQRRSAPMTIRSQHLAYLLFGLVIAGLLYGLRRYEMNRLRLKGNLRLERVEATKLRELDQAKSRFLANVSHEFRTPLTLMLGPLDDLRSGRYGPLSDAVVTQLDIARRNADRVLHLINQLQDVARLEAGRTPLRTRRLDLVVFVRNIFQKYEPMAERKVIHFDLHLPEGPLALYADPEHLEKSLSNLLSNAIKFTPEGGAVRVIIEDDPHAARVIIRDSGPGIAADEIVRVFDRFYRVNESPRQMHPGTGIGLALAKELVELHGGWLTVESEEGFGSTFTVALPQGRDHLAPDQIIDDGAAEQWMPRRPDPSSEDYSAVTADGAEPVDDVTTVLVVEDNAEVRAYIRGHLEPAYRVIEAADGEEGLARVRRHLPDLVLSDVMMPRLDGFALCRAIKADRETDFIPVILLTARAAHEDRVEGLQERADDYIVKPFDVTELRIRIENLINSRRHLRKRFSDADRPPGQVVSTGATAMDIEFLERLREHVLAHLADDTYNVERLAQAMGISRGHLHRRLQELLEQSPSDLIRTMRLDAAAHLLAIGAGTVSEVAYAVGFKSVAHFSNSFLNHFGCRPSDYRVPQD